MSIDKLPDDCLILIFQNLHELDDVLNCYSINLRWKQLIYHHRLVHVKYLYYFDFNNFFGIKPKLSLDTIYFYKNNELKETDLASLFPNVKVFSICEPLQLKLKKKTLCKFLADARKLKGLINISWLFSGEVIDRCKNLEMLATDYLSPCLLRYGPGRKIKQLHLMGHRLDAFRYDAKYFPNLKRLNIYNDDGRSEGMYNGPKLEKLKILELGITSEDGCDEYYGFEFMNFCPASESAYLLLKSNKHIVSTSTVNYNMRDLVLIYVGKASFKAFYSPIITTDAIMSFISFAQQSGCEQEWNSLRTNAISHIKTLSFA